MKDIEPILKQLAEKIVSYYKENKVANNGEFYFSGYTRVDKIRVIAPVSKHEDIGQKKINVPLYFDITYLDNEDHYANDRYEFNMPLLINDLKGNVEIIKEDNNGN